MNLEDDECRQPKWSLCLRNISTIGSGFLLAIYYFLLDILSFCHTCSPICRGFLLPVHYFLVDILSFFLSHLQFVCGRSTPFSNHKFWTKDVTEVDLRTSLPSGVPEPGRLPCSVTRLQLLGVQDSAVRRKGSSED